MDDDVARVAADAAAAQPLNVFVEPWFPTTLRPLRLDRLLRLLRSPELRGAVLMELAQRYASAPSATFEADVPDAAVRASVLDWWTRTYTCRAAAGTTQKANDSSLHIAASVDDDDEPLVAVDAAIVADVSASLAACWDGEPLAFGYDADAAVRTSDSRAAASRGDVASLVKVLHCTRNGRFGLVGAAVPSLLEALLDVDESERWACVGAFAVFGHVPILDQLAAEAAAPTSGTARHRERVAWGGAAVLEHAMCAALVAGRVRLAQHLVATPTAYVNPVFIVNQAVAVGGPSVLQRLLRTGGRGRTARF